MTTCTWSGAVSANWNVAGNWDTLPSAGDDLVFPSSASNKSNSNDFTADTSFNSITIQGTGYTLAGNRITLGAGGITQTTGTNTISLAIVLGANVTVSVAGTTLTLSGIISETGGARSLSKTDTAQLTLSGANTFTSGLTIKAGTVVGITTNSCLGGNGTGNVTIGDSGGSADAYLSFARSVTVANPIIIAAGSGGIRGITNNTTATPTYLGGITGTGDVTIQCTSTGTITFSTTALNHTGTITNSGTGTGTTTISAVIGTNVTAVTQASATSKLILSGTGTIANCSDKLAITSGQLQLGSANTVANLFIDATGCTDKTAQLMLAGNRQTITTEAKFRGSGVNRLLVTGDTLGVQRSIACTGATLANCQAVDFRDILFERGGASLDLSAITGGSGDCGGVGINLGGVLTLTTADDWYWYSASGGTYNLSDRTYWFTATNGGGTQMGADRGPLPQDMLYVDGSSINGTTTIDQDMPRMPGIDFTGCDPVAFHLDNVSQTCFGSWTSFANVTHAVSVPFYIYFQSRGAIVITPSNATYPFILVQSIGGSVSLGGDLVFNLNTGLYLDNGTFDAVGYNITTPRFNSNNANARTLLMGNGTWTVLRFWEFQTTTNLTTTAVGEMSTIVFGLDTDSTARTFAGGGLTYNNLSIVANTSGTQQITISGSNTFNTLTVNGPKTVNFTAGTTQTVSSFATTGTGIVLQSTSAGSPWYLIDTTGTNQVSNCTISDSYPRGSDAGGGALWDANVSRGNVDSSNNEDHNAATFRGWKFTGFALPIFGRGARSGDGKVFGSIIVRR